MNSRLKQFLSAENISQSQFADAIKVVRASVSHVLSGRNNPGYDFIKAIMTAYPTLNMDWLILGKGKMYKDIPSQLSTSVQDPNVHSISEEPELFNDDAFSEAIVPPIIQEYQQEPVSQFQYETQTISSSNCTQATVHQRRVVKVTIFFDDGTYQEM